MLLLRFVLFLLLPGMALLTTTLVVPRLGHRGEGALEAAARALAVTPPSPSALKALGIVYHDLGVEGVRGAAARAVATLERAQTGDAADPEVTAYLGSARTLLASETWNPLARVRGVAEGARLLDAAVAAAPDSVTIRFLRADTSLRLPAFFNRGHHARSDLERVLTLVGDARLSPGRRAEAHFKLGEAYRIDNDRRRARAQWAQAVAAAPGSRWAVAAGQRL